MNASACPDRVPSRMCSGWVRFWLLAALLAPVVVVSFPEETRAELRWVCRKCGRDLGRVGGGPAPRSCPYCNGVGNFSQSGGGVPGAAGAIVLVVLLVGGVIVVGGIVGLVFLIRALTAPAAPAARRRPYRARRRRDDDEEDYD